MIEFVIYNWQPIVFCAVMVAVVFGALAGICSHGDPRGYQPDHSDFEEKQGLYQQLVEHGCMACHERGETNHEFLEGPSGGLCTNVECSACGKRYNYSPLMQWAEEIN